MEWFENIIGKDLPKFNWFFDSTSDVKTDFESIMQVKNIEKISETLYKVIIDWKNYFVKYIPRKYNFESWFDKENTIVMDASVIMWVINTTNITQSSWVVFVSWDCNSPYLQYVYYDKEIDKVLINWYNKNSEIAFKAVHKL